MNLVEHKAQELQTPSPRSTGLSSLGFPEPRHGVSSLSIFTTVLWMSCLAIGTVGMVIPYTRPVPPQPMPPPVQAEILQVELSTEPFPEPSPPVAASSSLAPPPVVQPIAPPIETQPMTAVAEPSAVAFALPVEGPTVLVEPKRAQFAATPVVEDKPAPVAAPAPKQFVYGQGEGHQPAPEYPLRARREGQEGSVGIRFTVGEHGRVLAAETSVPSPWTLLNDAALRVVRERWRFSPGTLRFYEVTIRFQLTQ